MKEDGYFTGRDNGGLCLLKIGGTKTLIRSLIDNKSILVQITCKRLTYT